MKFQVIYPAGPGKRFDFDYYRDVHMPLVREILAPRSDTLVRGVPGLDGVEPGFVMIATLDFGDEATARAAFARPRVQEVMDDIPRFTDIEPTRQFGVDLA